MYIFRRNIHVAKTYVFNARISCFSHISKCDIILYAGLSTDSSK